MEDRKLATLRIIHKLQDADNSDNLEIASIDQWQTVVRRGEFSIGDLVVFFEVDAFLPEDDRYAFLGKSKTFQDAMGETHTGYRLKTVKLRGNISQGLALPASSFPEVSAYDINDDVSDVLHIIKWERPIPAELRGLMKGSFPVHLVPKTKAERYQNIKPTDKAVTYRVTEKLDGTSMTAFVNEGVLNVCSRNINLKETDSNTYWEVARKYNLENLPEGMAVQGEIFGEGIQSNPYKVRRQFAVFSVYNIAEQRYLNGEEMDSFCEKFFLPQVPFVQESEVVFSQRVIELYASEVETLASEFNDDLVIEGLVFDDFLGNKIKFLSKEYELKHG